MTDLDELKRDVATKFQEMRAALHMREKLLLRQIDVIEQQVGRTSTAAANGPMDIRFEAEQEAVLLASIRTFGRFQLDNMSLALHDVYLQNEDYIAPSNDHETMYKCLQQQQQQHATAAPPPDAVHVAAPDDCASATAIVVDFSKSKSLIEHNAKHLNESIINITVQEAKELIKKANVRRDTTIPPLNLEELDDEFESSIAEAVSSLAQDVPPTPAPLAGAKPKSKKSRFKPKITINNCNGTINLRNIASLTINCAGEEAVSADIPVAGVGDAVVSSSQCAKPKPNKTNKKTAKTSTPSSASSSSTVSSAVATVVESSSPTPTSSNYSSTASSRSQSKKQSKKQQQQQQQPMSKSISLSKSLTKINKPKGCASHPYEFALPDADAYGDVDAGVDTHTDIADDANSDEIVPTCEFYNRLLNEIKNSLRDKPRRSYEPPHHAVVTSTSSSAASSEPRAHTQHAGVTSTTTKSDSSSASTSTSMASASDAQGHGKRLVLKNFENLKIILEANSGDEESFHPVQIEQWLAEIITEADLEPMQNTEILEHSRIHNETL